MTRGEERNALLIEDLRKKNPQIQLSAMAWAELLPVVLWFLDKMWEIIQDHYGDSQPPNAVESLPDTTGRGRDVDR